MKNNSRAGSVLLENKLFKSMETGIQVSMHNTKVPLNTDLKATNTK